MDVTGIVKVVGKAVDFTKKNPTLVKEGIKIAGGVVKTRQKKSNEEDKITLLQSELDSLKHEVAYLKESINNNQKWIYISAGIGVLSLIVAIVATCL